MADNSRTEDRKKDIIDVATREFNIHGYAQTTMDAVAAEAGISKGSVYNYFQNKKDLFAQVVLAFSQSEVPRIDEIIGKAIPASEKLSAILDDWFDQLDRYNQIGRLVLEFMSVASGEDQEGQVSAILQDLYHDWRSQIAGVVQEGIDRGEFTGELDPVKAATMFIVACDGVQIQKIFNLVEIDREFLEAMKRGYLTVLRRPARTGASAGEASQ
jgi:AcrR family transcriptional regulator